MRAGGEVRIYQRSATASTLSFEKRRRKKKRVAKPGPGGGNEKICKQRCAMPRRWQITFIKSDRVEPSRGEFSIYQSSQPNIGLQRKTGWKKNGEKIGGKKGEQDGWEARAQPMANHILIKIDFQTRPTKRREENVVCA